MSFVNDWGTLKDGQWNGLTGLLQRKEIDIAGSLFLRHDRMEFADFIAHTISSK